MNTFWATFFLACSAVCGQVQKKDEKRTENLSDWKQGFINTPLSALPPSAIANLLPYLRAVNDVTSNVKSEKQVAAADPQSGFLAATAPLAVDRRPAPVVVATPVAKAVPAAALVATPTTIVQAQGPATLLPAAPPTVPRPVLHYPVGFPARLTALGAPGVISTQYPFISAPLAYSYRYPGVHASVFV